MPGRPKAIPMDGSLAYKKREAKRMDLAFGRRFDRDYEVRINADGVFDRERSTTGMN
jgi:hypothetical protein